MPVIVTNAKNRIAYNIVRSLGQKGIQVYTSDFVLHAMSFFSRYSEGHFLYPSPFKDQERFVDALIQNIRQLRSDVLIPVFEESFVISKFKEEFSKYVKVVIPDYEQVLIAHNKDRWQPVAQRLNIPVPETYAIEDMKEIANEIKDVHFPVLIKPKQGGGAWAINQVNSPTDLKTILSNASYNGLPWNRFLIQEKVNGETHCVAMLFRHGELRAKVTYKQLRDYPVTGGQATLRISLHNKQAEDCFQKLLEELNWHGVCQADFVFDRKTNIPYLIDVNPRFWGSLAQAIASNVDFPYLIYKIAVNGDVDPVKNFKTGVITRWIGGDLRTFVPLLRESQNKVEFLRRFIFPAKGKKIFYDDFDAKDPLPFFTWLMDAILRMVRYQSLSPAPHDSLEGIWK